MSISSWMKSFVLRRVFITSIGDKFGDIVCAEGGSLFYRDATWWVGIGFGDRIPRQQMT